MRIHPISQRVVFKNSQPLKPETVEMVKKHEVPLTVFVEQPDGSTKQVKMTKEEYKEYSLQQEKKKEEQRKQEELQKRQEWMAMISRPQSKEV